MGWGSQTSNTVSKAISPNDSKFLCCVVKAGIVLRLTARVCCGHTKDFFYIWQYVPGGQEGRGEFDCLAFWGFNPQWLGCKSLRCL